MNKHKDLTPKWKINSSSNSDEPMWDGYDQLIEEFTRK